MIKATTKRPYDCIRFVPGQGKYIHVLIPTGTYELVRVPTPLTSPCNWLVVKSEYEQGIYLGGSENSWRQWINGSVGRYGPIDWDDFEIILEEDGVLMPPLVD